MTNDDLRRQLQAIHDKHGYLDPEDVVAAAKSEKSTLHRYFQWDNNSAAHAHRVEQARALIRRVRIEVAHDDQPPIRVRAFVNVDPGGEAESRQYMPLGVVAEVPALRERVLAEARRDLERLQHKYRALGDAFTELLRAHVEDAG